MEMRPCSKAMLFPTINTVVSSLRIYVLTQLSTFLQQSHLAMPIFLHRLFLLSLLSLSATRVASLCPIYGPVFPPIKNLTASSTWRNAVTKIEAALDGAFAANKTIHGPISSDDTVSIQIFDKGDTILEYYNEGTDLAESGNNGTKIDGDSVYRIASVSKLYAVYILLVVAGDRVFGDMVVDYLPELRGVPGWDEISVGALAGQAGGVVADCKSSRHGPIYMFVNWNQYTMSTRSLVAASVPRSLARSRNSLATRPRRA